MIDTSTIDPRLTDEYGVTLQKAEGYVTTAAAALRGMAGTSGRYTDLVTGGRLDLTDGYDRSLAMSGLAQPRELSLGTVQVDVRADRRSDSVTIPLAEEATLEAQGLPFALSGTAALAELGAAQLDFATGALLGAPANYDAGLVVAPGLISTSSTKLLRALEALAGAIVDASGVYPDTVAINAEGAGYLQDLDEIRAAMGASLSGTARLPRAALLEVLQRYIPTLRQVLVYERTYRDAGGTSVPFLADGMLALYRTQALGVSFVNTYVPTIQGVGPAIAGVRLLRKADEPVPYAAVVSDAYWGVVKGQGRSGLAGGLCTGLWA